MFSKRLYIVNSQKTLHAFSRNYLLHANVPQIWNYPFTYAMVFFFAKCLYIQIWAYLSPKRSNAIYHLYIEFICKRTSWKKSYSRDLDNSQYQYSKDLVSSNQVFFLYLITLRNIGYIKIYGFRKIQALVYHKFYYYARW